MGVRNQKDFQLWIMLSKRKKGKKFSVNVPKDHLGHFSPLSLGKMSNVKMSSVSNQNLNRNDMVKSILPPNTSTSRSRFLVTERRNPVFGYQSFAELSEFLFPCNNYVAEDKLSK